MNRQKSPLPEFKQEKKSSNFYVFNTSKIGILQHVLFSQCLYTDYMTIFTFSSRSNKCFK